MAATFDNKILSSPHPKPDTFFKLDLIIIKFQLKSQEISLKMPQPAEI